MKDISNEELSSVVGSGSSSGFPPAAAAEDGIGPGCICWKRAAVRALFPLQSLAGFAALHARPDWNNTEQR